MKNYLKEIIIILVQLFIFYISPLFAGPSDAIGMVFFIFIATLILSGIMGCISKEKIKYFYPVIISILFIPAIFIYYNDSAFIYILWYFIISSAGIFIGIIINKLIKNK